MENNNNNNNNDNSDIDNKDKFNSTLNMYTVFMSIMTGVSKYDIVQAFNMVNRDVEDSIFINDLNVLNLNLEFKKLSGKTKADIVKTGTTIKYIDLMNSKLINSQRLDSNNKLVDVITNYDQVIKIGDYRESLEILKKYINISYEINNSNKQLIITRKDNIPRIFNLDIIFRQIRIGEEEYIAPYLNDFNFTEQFLRLLNEYERNILVNLLLTMKAIKINIDELNNLSGTLGQISLQSFGLISLTTKKLYDELLNRKNIQHQISNIDNFSENEINYIYTLFVDILQTNNAESINNLLIYVNSGKYNYILTALSTLNKSDFENIINILYRNTNDKDAFNRFINLLNRSMRYDNLNVELVDNDYRITTNIINEQQEEQGQIGIILNNMFDQLQTELQRQNNTNLNVIVREEEEEEKPILYEEIDKAAALLEIIGNNVKGIDNWESIGDGILNRIQNLNEAADISRNLINNPGSSNPINNAVTNIEATYSDIVMQDLGINTYVRSIIPKLILSSIQNTYNLINQPVPNMARNVLNFVSVSYILGMTYNNIFNNFFTTSINLLLSSITLINSYGNYNNALNNVIGAYVLLKISISAYYLLINPDPDDVLLYDEVQQINTSTQNNFTHQPTIINENEELENNVINEVSNNYFYNLGDRFKYMAIGSFISVVSGLLIYNRSFNDKLLYPSLLFGSVGLYVFYKSASGDTEAITSLIRMGENATDAVIKSISAGSEIISSTVSGLKKISPYIYVLIIGGIAISVIYSLSSSAKNIKEVVKKDPDHYKVKIIKE